MTEGQKKELAEAVRAVCESADSRMVTVTSDKHYPRDAWDVLELQDAISAATKGTKAWGYVAVMRNEKDYQEFALVLSPRDGGP